MPEVMLDNERDSFGIVSGEGGERATCDDTTTGVLQQWTPQKEAHSEEFSPVRLIRRRGLAVVAKSARQNCSSMHPLSTLTPHFPSRTERYTVFVAPQASLLFGNKKLMTLVVRFLPIDAWIISVCPLNKNCSVLVELLCRTRHKVFHRHLLDWNSMNSRIRVSGLAWFPATKKDDSCWGLSLEGLRFRWRQITYIEKHVLHHHLGPFFEQHAEEQNTLALREQWMQLSEEVAKLKEGVVRWSVTKEAWEHRHVVYSGEIFGVFVDAFVARKNYEILIHLDGTPNDLSFVG